MTKSAFGPVCVLRCGFTFRVDDLWWCPTCGDTQLRPVTDKGDTLESVVTAAQVAERQRALRAPLVKPVTVTSEEYEP